MKLSFILVLSFLMLAVADNISAQSTDNRLLTSEVPATRFLYQDLNKSQPQQTTISQANAPIVREHVAPTHCLIFNKAFVRCLQ